MHTLLCRLRQEHGHGALEDRPTIDVSEETDAWRSYLAWRPDAEALIGSGVWRFEFRFLDAMDSNTRDYRADFIIRRTDGTDVRLHPGAIDAVPVYGQLAQWQASTSAWPGLLHGAAPAPTRGSWAARVAKVDDGGNQRYDRVSQADVYGRQAAKRFLDEQAAQGESDTSPPSWEKDIADGAWPWWLYFAGKVWAVDLDVSQCWIAPSQTTHLPCFWGVTPTGLSFEVTPGAGTGWQEFRWCDDEEEAPALRGGSASWRWCAAAPAWSGGKTGWGSAAQEPEDPPAQRGARGSSSADWNRAAWNSAPTSRPDVSSRGSSSAAAWSAKAWTGRTDYGWRAGR